VHKVCALLEERFVKFSGVDGALNIPEANDFMGVHSALKSSVDDFEQITGKRPALQNITESFTTTASGGGIIVGFVDLRLIRQLSAQGLLEVSDV
jgi:hypothetical protein